MTYSSAYLRVDSEGRIDVDASLRLTGSSLIRCHTYDGKPPILALDDRSVSVSVTIPDRGRVTAEDVETARALANEAARYATELAALARHQQGAKAADCAA